MSCVVLRQTIHSPILQRDWPYLLLVPNLPDLHERSCPTVYLLHGACGSAQDFVEQGQLHTTVERLIDHARITPSCLIMPEGFDSWYVDGEALALQTAFLEDFMPQVERRLGQVVTRRDRSIAGISMGGFGALRLALLRPNLFHAVALMSPAIYHDLPPEGSSARVDPPFQQKVRSIRSSGTAMAGRP